MEGAQRILGQRRRIFLGSLSRLREVRQEPERGGGRGETTTGGPSTALLDHHLDFFARPPRVLLFALFQRAVARTRFLPSWFRRQVALEKPRRLSAAALVRCATAGSRWNRAEGLISSRRVRSQPAAGRNLACRKPSVSPSRLRGQQRRTAGKSWHVVESRSPGGAHFLLFVQGTLEATPSSARRNAWEPRKKIAGTCLDPEKTPLPCLARRLQCPRAQAQTLP